MKKRDAILEGIVDQSPLTANDIVTRFGGPGEGIWGGVMVIVMTNV